MHSLDTLRYCKRLEAVGVPREQAEVHAQVLAEVMSQVATKDDLAALKTWVETWVALYVKEQIQPLKSDLLKLFLTISVAQTGLIIAALLYLPH
jgi:pyrroloquinoline quinone (PQQ) biosynthesis protein C